MSKCGLITTRKLFTSFRDSTAWIMTLAKGFKKTMLQRGWLIFSKSSRCMCDICAKCYKLVCMSSKIVFLIHFIWSVMENRIVELSSTQILECIAQKLKNWFAKAQRIHFFKVFIWIVIKDGIFELLLLITTNYSNVMVKI